MYGCFPCTKSTRVIAIQKEFPSKLKKINYQIRGGGHEEEAAARAAKGQQGGLQLSSPTFPAADAKADTMQ